MIEINLIGDKRAEPPRLGAIDPAQRITAACTAILVLAVLIVGWRYWSLRQEMGAMEQALAEADAELDRLEPVLERVRQADAQRVQLAQRVVLIEQLRQGQSGPVRMLDAISRALPEGLWLTSLEQQGTVVTIDGHALALTAISDLVANLEAADVFAQPIEIVESKISAMDTGDLVSFQLRAMLTPPS